MSGDGMNKRLLIYVALFTIFVCCVFVSYNPTIAQDYSSNFTDGEVFMPHNSHFDFRDFSLNSTNTKNFTTRTISNGHTQFIDNTGNITINYIELNKMIHINKDNTVSFLNDELKKPSWSVDGVSVHEIDFRFYDELYSAYCKNSSENTIIYLSTPNEQETADLMNSLSFNE